MKVSLSRKITTMKLPIPDWAQADIYYSFTGVEYASIVSEDMDTDEAIEKISSFIQELDNILKGLKEGEE